MAARRSSRAEKTVAIEGGGELLIVAAGLWVAYTVFQKFAAKGALINGPTADNPVYDAATGIEQSITGNSTDSLGTWFYDLVHGSSAASTMATPSAPAPVGVSAPSGLDDLYSTSGGIG